MKKYSFLIFLLLALTAATAWAVTVNLTPTSTNAATAEAVILAQGSFANITRDELDPSVCFETVINANGSFIVPAQILGQRAGKVIFQAEDSGGGVSGALTGHASLQTTGDRWIDLKDGGTTVNCAADCTFQLNDGTRGPFRRYKITQATHASGAWNARVCFEKM